MVAWPMVAEAGDYAMLSPLTGTGYEHYYHARVTATGPNRSVVVRLLEGPRRGQTINIPADRTALIERTPLPVGAEVVLGVPPRAPDTPESYFLIDHYRLGTYAWLAAGFVALAIGIGRWRGFTALVGLAVSFGIIALWIIPGIIRGNNPFTTCLTGTFMIAGASLYLAHGFNRRTSLALVATVATLLAGTALSLIAVGAANLTGLAGEGAAALAFQAAPGLDLQGLLLGGMMIGVLGILDDITTAQVAVVAQLHEANAALSAAELYRRGLRVGQEHIASLINTLVLAYAGASFSLLVFLAVHPAMPLFMTLNNELIGEEVIRTLVGGAALVAAVPLATVLAAYILPRLPRRALMPEWWPRTHR